MLKIVAAVINDNNKLLMVRAKNRPFFTSPEVVQPDVVDAVGALRREVERETHLHVMGLDPIGTFTLHEQQYHDLVEITFYQVRVLGTPCPAEDIEEIKWINASYKEEGIPVDHLIEYFIFPRIFQQTKQVS